MTNPGIVSRENGVCHLTMRVTIATAQQHQRFRCQWIAYFQAVRMSHSTSESVETLHSRGRWKLLDEDRFSKNSAESSACLLEFRFLRQVLFRPNSGRLRRYVGGFLGEKNRVCTRSSLEAMTNQSQNRESQKWLFLCLCTWKSIKTWNYGEVLYFIL